MSALKKMQEDQTDICTAGGRSKFWIAQVNKDTIQFKRSTGKRTWPLKYNKLKEIHDLVHKGEVDLNQYEIDEKIPTFGNYVTGLLKHLGCGRTLNSNSGQDDGSK